MMQQVITILSPKRYLPGNFIFYLHYRFTVLLLVIFSFIVTCRLLLGNSFSCKTDIRSNLQFIEAKCYAETVFSLPGQLVSNIDDGVLVTPDPSIDSFRRYQSYYSWVNLLLLVHAFNFYLPRLLWKSFESGYMCKLTIGLDDIRAKEGKRGSELCYLAKYIIVTQGKHKLYTSMFIFCEMCNYAISLSHTLWLVYFFDVTGVPDFLPFELKTWWDFRQFYFPSTGTCAYMEKGESNFPIVCVLPLNHMYMFMFLFIHAWYIILTILSGSILVYRIALLVPSFRVNVTKFHAPLSERPTLKSLCCRLSYSDWFFLSRFQKMMTDIDFAQILEKIVVISQCKEFENQHNVENRLSFCEEIHKELDSSTATSPV